MKTLIMCHSYHHGNTKKIADAMAAVLHTEVVSPSDVHTETLDGYDLVGFGSGIAFGKHYKQTSKWSTGFPLFKKNAFVFSTRGASRMGSQHHALRRQLEEKGWNVVGEFSCRGYDTYGLTKLMGGIAKGRPNEQDMHDAEQFAASIA